MPREPRTAKLGPLAIAAVLALAVTLAGDALMGAPTPAASPLPSDVELIAAGGRWRPRVTTTTTKPVVTTTTARPVVTTTTVAPTTTTTKPVVTTTTVPSSTTVPAPTTTVPAPTTTITAPAPTTGLSSTAAADMLAQVNARRATGTTCGGVAYGRVPALALNATIARAADGHAVDMATRNFFSHTGSNGSTAGTRLLAVGYRWSAYGENIAAGQTTTTSVVTAWFNSAGHCANFMSPNVTQIGFAKATSSTSTYGIYWVADLARPA